MMTYEELTDYITIPRTDYYTTLLTHSEVILRAYRTRNQTQLGQELHLNQTQVSFLLKLLTAYSELNLKDQ